MPHPKTTKMFYNCPMPNGEPLSEREQEILRLVATGASNKEIAQALTISPNTVKVHMRNIFAKIEVFSRTEATLYALKSGLIPSPAAELETAPIPEPVEEETIAIPELLPQQSSSNRRISAALLVLLLIAAMLVATRLPSSQPAPATVNVSPQRWTISTDMPQALSAPAAAVYEQSAYLIGGASAGAASPATWQYQFTDDTWQARTAKPVAVSDAGAAVIGERIYVPGGLGADGQPTDRLDVYLPRSDEWLTLAPLPHPIYAYGLAAYEGRLYLFGGSDGTQPLDTVYIYDPESDAWESGHPMPQKCAYLATVSISGKILVLGGRDENRSLDTNLAYYPQRDQAGESPWETLRSLPEARHAFAAALLADGVYLVGGAGNGADEPAAVIYDIAADRWSNMDDRIERESPGYGTRLAAIPWKTSVHIFGGEIASAPSSQHISYQAIYTISLPVLQSGDK